MKQARLFVMKSSYWCVLMALLVVGVYGLAIRYPRLYSRMGAGVHERWFNDTRAVLLCSDVVAAGGDPAVPNPVAVHYYSHWWFMLSEWGLTQADYAWLGLVGGLGFLFSAILVLSPTSAGGAMVGFILLVSPPIQLGFNRGNVDLLIFILLAPIPFFLTRARGGWSVLVPVIIALCAGLKYYPIVAGVVLLLAVQSRRRRWVLIFLMVLLASLVALSVVPDYLRVAAIMPSPSKLYSFGADRFWSLVGVPGWAMHGCSLTLLSLAAVFWLRLKIKFPPALASFQVVAFALGASLLLGCFMMGNSYSYRLVFALFMVPLLLQLGAPGGFSSQVLARLGLFLMVVLFWVDGGFGFAMMGAVTQGCLGPESFWWTSNSWVSACLGGSWVLVIEGLLISLLWPAIQQLVSGHDNTEAG